MNLEGIIAVSLLGLKKILFKNHFVIEMLNIQCFQFLMHNNIFLRTNCFYQPINDSTASHRIPFLLRIFSICI